MLPWLCIYLAVRVQVRHEPRYERLVPVMVHVNYHPNKQERMRAIWAAYITGDRAALQALPDGSER